MSRVRLALSVLTLTNLQCTVDRSLSWHRASFHNSFTICLPSLVGAFSSDLQSTFIGASSLHPSLFSPAPTLQLCSSGWPWTEGLPAFASQAQDYRLKATQSLGRFKVLGIALVVVLHRVGRRHSETPTCAITVWIVALTEENFLIGMQPSLPIICSWLYLNLPCCVPKGRFIFNDQKLLPQQSAADMRTCL